MAAIFHRQAQSPTSTLKKSHHLIALLVNTFILVTYVSAWTNRFNYTKHAKRWLNTSSVSMATHTWKIKDQEVHLGCPRYSAYKVQEEQNIMIKDEQMQEYCMSRMKLGTSNFVINNFRWYYKGYTITVSCKEWHRGGHETYHKSDSLTCRLAQAHLQMSMYNSNLYWSQLLCHCKHVYFVLLKLKPTAFEGPERTASMYNSHESAVGLQDMWHSCRSVRMGLKPMTAQFGSESPCGLLLSDCAWDLPKWSFHCCHCPARQTSCKPGGCLYLISFPSPSVCISHIPICCKMNTRKVTKVKYSAMSIWCGSNQLCLSMN